MRILAVDPGAERCGWAVLEPGPKYIRSGIFSCARNGEDFQQYRIRLEHAAFEYFDERIEVVKYGARTDGSDTNIINEITPAVGGGNFVTATQSYLVNCVVTALHLAAFKHGLMPEQIAARTVQSKIALKTRRTQKVTKVQVRNGVLTILPELLPRLKEWVNIFDEPDAIAVGLAYLGYNIKDYVTKS